MDIPPEGSLGLLAYGHRGLVAWRAARGNAWLEDERERYVALAEKKARKQSPSAPARKVAEALASTELIVVSGLPRSGTSMLMQMVVAGGLNAYVDRDRAADESNPTGYFEHDRIRSLAQDASWVPEASGLVAKVVSPLLPHLPRGPRYRVLVLERSLDEILRSQRRMLGRLDRPALDDKVLRPAYQRQMEAAEAWIQRTPRTEALVLNHRDILREPAHAAVRIATFLQREMDTDAMAAAVDPSLHRERVPKP